MKIPAKQEELPTTDTDKVNLSPVFKFQFDWVNVQLLSVSVAELVADVGVVYVTPPVNTAPSKGVHLHSYFTVLEVTGVAESFLHDEKMKSPSQKIKVFSSFAKIFI